MLLFLGHTQQLCVCFAHQAGAITSMKGKICVYVRRHTVQTSPGTNARGQPLNEGLLQALLTLSVSIYTPVHLSYDAIYRIYQHQTCPHLALVRSCTGDFLQLNFHLEIIQLLLGDSDSYIVSQQQYIQLQVLFFPRIHALIVRLCRPAVLLWQKQLIQFNKAHLI